jgi:pantoate--beta-alanine ligase
LKISRTNSEVRSLIKILRREGKSLGFVPTMGALHAGHISLIEKSIEENKATVVSIFVNPTQFNDKQDFRSYPKNLKEDLEKLRPYSVDLVFAPDSGEIYPEPDKRVFDFGGLDKTMEGEHRPGHFNGVAQVVSRMFEIIEPDIAYFGEKDFQQLAIIRKMVSDTGLPVRIEGCPIIREPDGLAMSSRNKLLSPEERKSAARISHALTRAKNKAGQLSVESLKEHTLNFLQEDPGIRAEYFEIVREHDLNPISGWNEESRKRGCIAVKIGQVRLIDNMDFSL